MKPPHIVVTTGEPAGIGPDIVLALADFTIRIPTDAKLTVLGDRDLFAERAETLGILVQFTEEEQPPDHRGDGTLNIQHLPTAVPVQAGVTDPRNADYVLEQLKTAVRGCSDGSFDAMVTAPVNKAVINEAGHTFSGHTEYLGELTNSYPVMMLASETLRVALVTTHLPLREIAATITADRLEKTLRIVADGLKKYCGLDQPALGVCGLNPHAGEQGHLGDEEQTIIIPVLDKLKQQGLNLIGPLPADTAFVSDHLKTLDAVVCMYHDQGLPVIKHAGFGKVVNVTLGLPFLRTSVDHGTALDLAASGKASDSSLISAITWANWGVECQAINESEV